MRSLFEIKIEKPSEDISVELKTQAINALEDGKVLFFPNLGFKLNYEEKEFLKPNTFDLKVKSLKYNLKENKLWGVKHFAQEEELKEMIRRYSLFSQELIQNILPHYKNAMKMVNASLRPVEAEGRKQSKRHDDTRLHVDAFPSRPVKGERLLRVFCNINQEGSPRVWNAGEAFEEVATRFLPQISKPLPFSSHILKALKITKSLRTKYDHYMLGLHDTMKLDDNYQKNARKEKIEFPPNSVWVCFSDKTSHAVLSGRGLLEQTIYLPAEGMLHPSKSPLQIMEKMLGRKLV